MMTSSGFDVIGEEIMVDGALLSAKLGLTEKQLKHAMDCGQLPLRRFEPRLRWKAGPDNED